MIIQYPTYLDDLRVIPIPIPCPSHAHPIPQPLPRLFVKRCRGLAVAARPGFVSPQRARRALRARRRGAADRPGGAQEALGAGG